MFQVTAKDRKSYPGSLVLDALDELSVTTGRACKTITTSFNAIAPNKLQRTDTFLCLRILRVQQRGQPPVRKGTRSTGGLVTCTCTEQGRPYKPLAEYSEYSEYAGFSVAMA
jgi:hypothetical protein